MKCHFLAFWFILLSIPSALLAQDTASITGTVTDPSGAAVAGAQVTLASPEHGVERAVPTNNSGGYLFGSLPIGSYNLTVAMPGFKTYKAKGIILQVAQKARVDVALQVGGAKEEVMVVGSSVAQVETQNSELSGVVNGKEISQLELNGRNFTQLATLVPGVSNQSGLDEGAEGLNGNVSFSMNGGRTEYNNWELDGGDNMDNGSNTTLNIYPSIDAIGEFRVLTSNYGAQYGRNGSGTVEVEIKSGTASFHGDAYEFVRNDVFNARNYFQSTVPPYKKNDFGYTFGGPIYIPNLYNTDKQKTFFFWSQEWRRDRVPGQVFNILVPSATERMGNFSDLCPNTSGGTPSYADCPTVPGSGGTQYFTGNQVPVSPVGQALLALIPPPNAGVPGAALYNASPNQPTNWREELLRVDHNINSKVRAMFHYAHDSWDSVTPTPLFSGSNFPTVQTTTKLPTVSVVARLSAAISPTLLNEFTFSYTTDHIFTSSTGYPNPNAWQRPSGLPMSSFFSNGFDGKLPTITLTGNTAYGGGFYQDVNGEWPEGKYNSNPTYTYRDNVTKIVGRHNLQAGAYFVAAQKNELSGVFVNGSLGFDVSSAVTTGNAFADLLMGQVASYTQGSNQIKYYNRYKIFEPYLQDDWRVTDRLTLNLGLRISLFGTYRDRYRQAYNWDPAVYSLSTAPQIDIDGSLTGFPGALVPGVGNIFDGLVQCGVNGVPAGCSKGHLFNPAPRIGFAWDPWGNGKTAIRGGYGIFFEHTNGNEADTEAMESQSSPLLQSPTQYNVTGYANLGTGGSTTPVAFPLTFFSIPDKAIWPYMQQWHLDVQREVAKNMVCTLSYVGSKGTHLNRQYDLNQIFPVPLSQNPYAVGQPISADDCGTVSIDPTSGQASATVNGISMTSGWANNLAVACGNNPDPYRPHYGLGSITRLENSASSTYHALQASLRKNVGALLINGSYTYSHSIDNASSRYDAGFANSYDPQAARANSAFDIRHMINVGYVYDLPFFKGAGLTHRVLGGWQYSGIASWQTGTPFGVVNSANYPDNAGVGGAANVVTGSYADVVGNPKSGIPPTSESNIAGYAGLLYNPGVFFAPRGLTFGDSGRNFLRNPVRTNFDMALFKHFAVTESNAFEFRAEAFNIFNHTEFAPIAGDGGSATYNGGPSSGTNMAACYGGANNSAGDPSCLSNSNFLHLGAAHLPRILQLGAKFIF